MILVDSSVWIEYFNGIKNRESDLLDHLLDNEMIITGDLIITEVLQGFRKDNDYRTAKGLFEMLPFYSLAGKEVAIQSADNYRFLRKKGITPRKTIDLLIGTFCIVNEIPLLHNDKDFDVLSEFFDLKIL